MVKENEKLNTLEISLSQIFMITVKSNTSKIEKLESFIRHQKLKIIQELWTFSYKHFLKLFFNLKFLESNKHLKPSK